MRTQFSFLWGTMEEFILGKVCHDDFDFPVHGRQFMVTIGSVDIWRKAWILAELAINQSENAQIAIKTEPNVNLIIYEKVAATTSRYVATRVMWVFITITITKTITIIIPIIVTIIIRCGKGEFAHPPLFTILASTTLGINLHFHHCLTRFWQAQVDTMTPGWCWRTWCTWLTGCPPSSQLPEWVRRSLTRKGNDRVE